MDGAVGSLAAKNHPEPQLPGAASDGAARTPSHRMGRQTLALGSASLGLHNLVGWGSDCPGVP